MTLCFHISKYLIITQRLSGLHDFERWEKIAWYVYTTIIITVISIGLTLLFSEYDKSIRGIIDYNIFIVLFVPAIAGVHSAYRLSYEECKKKNMTDNKGGNYIQW